MGRTRTLVRRFSATLALAWLAVLLSFAGRAAAGEPLDPKEVPEPLKPWIGWATAGAERCPGLHGQKDASRCAWPSRLDLAVGEQGGRFTQRWHADATAWVPLPGDEKRWPLGVQVDGAKASVVPQSAVPSVHVEKGDHVVTGSFLWDSPPESLRVPPETGLLALTLRAAPVAAPLRDAQGAVFLQRTTAREEGEKLEILAYRKVTDAIPLTLTTHLELDVAGKSREVLLGKGLPPGFVPMSLESQLPARVEEGGRLRVQVRPGRFAIDLLARAEGPQNRLVRPAPEGPWREGEEVWVFEAKTDLRLVDVAGPSAIDPAQTSLPDAWKRFPAYPMKVGEALALQERRRGDADPPADQITLVRSLWLDFDGAGYTVSDKLTGTLNRDARLEMAAPTVLGRVAMLGRDQFITHLGDPTEQGVEVRQGEIDVAADSRIAAGPRDLPAVGWKHDMHQVRGTLHLPPGWRLLHASGADDVPGTWLRGWSLLKIFLALITAIVIGRLYGWRWSLPALAMLGLTLTEPDAPRWIWLFVLGAEALVRVLPDGLVRRIARVVRAGVLVVAALVAIPFLTDDVRQGMYPVLASPSASVGSGLVLAGGEDTDSLEFGRKQEEIALPGAGVAAQPAAPAPPAKEEPAALDQATTVAGQVDERKDAVEKTKLPANAPASRSTTGLSRQAWGSNNGKANTAQFNTETYDPNAVVQTGPGLPRWQWSNIELTFSGPVAATQRLQLWLLPPGVNFALAFARLLLVALVLARMVPYFSRFWPKGWGSPPAPPAVPAKGAVAAAGLVAVLAVFAAPAAARADVPDKATLDELRARLLAKPACEPTCAASGRLLLELRPGTLRGRMEVDAAAAVGVPLPGTASQWLPDDVTVDGQAAKALVRTGDGVLWVAISPGSHQIAFEGRAPERDSVQLPLHLRPHRVEVTSDGWEVAGVHEDGLADENLQFTRIAKQGAAAAGLQQGTLPPFVRVERTLSIGLNWQADTRVVRVTPVGAAVVVEVPLLPGESVTTADVRVLGGKALVNMAPGAADVSWHSVIEQKSPLRLVAPKSVAWTEVWRADVGPIWHATFSGIPVVHAQSTNGRVLPEWRPWPGEDAQIELGRPDGVQGQSLTIDAAQMQVSPGVRATDVTLTLSLRSSRGRALDVTLPSGAQLESYKLDGVSQPVRQEGRKVALQLVPGAQQVELGWRENAGIAPLLRVSAVDLGAPAANVTVVLQQPSRWVLFAGGPRVGPAVLFWSGLLVMLLVAVALARVPWTPLRTWHWLLLALGLSQVDIVAGAIFAGWLIALGWRKSRPELRRGWFDARQVLLVVWTLAALVVLAVAIHQGLLGSPEMQVRGNGSSSARLVWFQDRSLGAMPTPWLVSLPMLVYRGAMLAWALWAALAVVRWLRWGWGAFSEGGLWKKAPPRAPRPAPPAQPAPPAVGAP